MFLKQMSWNRDNLRVHSVRHVLTIRDTEMTNRMFKKTPVREKLARPLRLIRETR